MSDRLDPACGSGHFLLEAFDLFYDMYEEEHRLCVFASLRERTWQIYDVHDQAFVIQALVADYQLFDEKPSLEGVRKLADYLIGRWPSKPAGWTERIPGNEASRRTQFLCSCSSAN